MRIDVKTDTVLVQEYMQGNEFALQELIQKHRTKIFSYIYSKIQNQDLAEDVFQDTFVKVIKTLKAGRYNEEGKFLPWVMRISHNLVIDHFRKNKRMPMMRVTEEYNIFDTIKDGALSSEKQMIKEQIEGDLRLLIEELPEEQKKVLTMRYYSDMSFKDIAEQCDISINTALGRMRYALINLRKMIEKNNISLTV